MRHVGKWEANHHQLLEPESELGRAVTRTGGAEEEGAGPVGVPIATVKAGGKEKWEKEREGRGSMQQKQYGGYEERQEGRLCPESSRATLDGLD